MNRPDRRQGPCCVSSVHKSAAGLWLASGLLWCCGDWTACGDAPLCLGNCSDRLRAAASALEAHSLLLCGREREGVREYTHSQHASIRFTRDAAFFQRCSRSPCLHGPSSAPRGRPNRQPARLLSLECCPSSPHTSPYRLRTSPRRRPHALAHADLHRCCAPDAAQPNSTRSANLTPSPVPRSPCAAPSITTAAAS
jgi:hypothetical protein